MSESPLGLVARLVALDGPGGAGLAELYLELAPGAVAANPTASDEVVSRALALVAESGASYGGDYTMLVATDLGRALRYRRFAVEHWSTLLEAFNAYGDAPFLLAYAVGNQPPDPSVTELIVRDPTADWADALLAGPWRRTLSLGDREWALHHASLGSLVEIEDGPLALLSVADPDFVPDEVIADRLDAFMTNYGLTDLLFDRRPGLVERLGVEAGADLSRWELVAACRHLGGRGQQRALESALEGLADHRSFEARGVLAALISNPALEHAVLDAMREGLADHLRTHVEASDWDGHQVAGLLEGAVERQLLALPEGAPIGQWSSESVAGFAELLRRLPHGLSRLAARLDLLGDPRLSSEARMAEAINLRRLLAVTSTPPDVLFARSGPFSWGAGMGRHCDHSCVEAVASGECRHGVNPDVVEQLGRALSVAATTVNNDLEEGYRGPRVAERVLTHALGRLRGDERSHRALAALVEDSRLAILDLVETAQSVAERR